MREKLAEKRKRLQDEFNALSPLAEMSAEQNARLLAIPGEVQAIDAEVEKINAADAAKAQAALMFASGPSAAPVPSFVGASFAEGSRIEMGKAPIDRDPKSGFQGVSDFLKVVQAGSRPGAVVDPRIGKLMAAAYGNNTLAGEDGGFLVYPEMATEIFKRTQAAGLGILAKCAQATTRGNSYIENALVDHDRSSTTYRNGGVIVYWPGEAGQITRSNPKFRQIETKVHKMACLTFLTEEQLSDSDLNEAMILKMFADAIVDESEEMLFNGTGVGQPLGILNGAALVSQDKETDQLATTIAAQNVIKMYGRVVSPSKMKGAWYCNQEATPQLEQMTIVVGAGGVPVYLPPGGLADAPNGRLRSREVVETDHCAALGTVGDIVFADWSQYRLVTKGGGAAIKTSMSIHIRFDYDETAFKATFRIGGQPLWNAALTPRRGSSTLGPFVALATRA